MEEVNDKELERLLDMQEHPENYSDEELEAMLDNDDLRLLSEAKRALAQSKALLSEKFISSEECGVRSEELYASPSSTSKSNNSSLLTPHSSLKIYKVAAMFIGCILLAGIAYAAVRFVKEREPMPISENDTEIAAPRQSSIATAETEKKDTTAIAGVRQFDDCELGAILSAMAEHYNLKVVYENEAASSIKLFFKWDSDASVDRALEVLNNFDRINIEHRGDALIVK